MVGGRSRRRLISQDLLLDGFFCLPQLQSVDHVLNDVLIEVVLCDDVGIDNTVVGQAKAPAHPWVCPDVGHLDAVLWVGLEKTAEEVFALCGIENEL